MQVSEACSTIFGDRFTDGFGCEIIDVQNHNNQ